MLRRLPGAPWGCLVAAASARCALSDREVSGMVVCRCCMLCAVFAGPPARLGIFMLSTSKHVGPCGPVSWQCAFFDGVSPATSRPQMRAIANMYKAMHMHCSMLKLTQAFGGRQQSSTEPWQTCRHRALRLCGQIRSRLGPYSMFSSAQQAAKSSSRCLRPQINASAVELTR